MKWKEMQLRYILRDKEDKMFCISDLILTLMFSVDSDINSVDINTTEENGQRG